VVKHAGLNEDDGEWLDVRLCVGKLSFVILRMSKMQVVLALTCIVVGVCVAVR